MAAVSGRGFVQTYAVDLHGAGVEVTQNASVLGKDWVQTCAYYDPAHRVGKGFKYNTRAQRTFGNGGITGVCLGSESLAPFKFCDALSLTGGGGIVSPCETTWFMLTICASFILTSASVGETERSAPTVDLQSFRWIGIGARGGNARHRQER